MPVTGLYDPMLYDVLLRRGHNHVPCAQPAENPFKSMIGMTVQAVTPDSNSSSLQPAEDPFKSMPVESLVTSTLTDLPRLAKEGADIDTLLAVSRQAAKAAAAPKPSAGGAPKPYAGAAGSLLKSAAAMWPEARGEIAKGSPPKGAAAAMQPVVGGDVGIAWHDGLGAKPIDDFFHG